MKPIKKQIALLAIGSLLLNGTVLAAPPKPNVVDTGNKWHITYYSDSHSSHGTDGITHELCFLPYTTVGTSIQGTWYATSFPDWNGRYYQEGDEVKMIGDFANDVGHDHMTLIHTTGNGGMAFKDWTEWREDGEFGRIKGWGNAKMVRVGECAPSVNNRREKGISRNFSHLLDSLGLKDKALHESYNAPPRLTTDGSVADSPSQSNLESLRVYQEHTN